MKEKHISPANKEVWSDTVGAGEGLCFFPSSFSGVSGLYYQGYPTVHDGLRNLAILSLTTAAGRKEAETEHSSHQKKKIEFFLFFCKQVQVHGTTEWKVQRFSIYLLSSHMRYQHAPSSLLIFRTFSQKSRSTFLLTSHLVRAQLYGALIYLWQIERWHLLAVG